MGICPRCGSFVDEGEPYCPDCSYIFGGESSSDSTYTLRSDSLEINDFEYDLDDVEDALEQLGYDLDDLERGLVDIDELEELLERY